MKNTKYLALGLAGVIAFSPMTSLAANNVINTKGYKEVMAEEEVVVGYIEYKGKITDIETDITKENISILVEGKETIPQGKIVFHITEDISILSQNTKEFVAREDLEEDSEITVFFREDTPMAMSIPPQMTPDAILINDSEETGFVKVSHFNKDLIDIDNELKLNISNDTVIVDTAGKKINEKNLEDSDLMVLYTTSTKSIPAQTTPEKIVVLADMDIEDVDDDSDETEDLITVEDLVTVMDKVILNGKEIKLKHEIYKSYDGHYMFALRPISETLGYKVSWNNSTRSVELTKGTQWTKVTIGSTNYNFAKMIVKLEKAPEIKNSKTYVPVEFLEEVLKLNVDVNKGILEVK